MEQAIFAVYPAMGSGFEKFLYFENGAALATIKKQRDKQRHASFVKILTKTTQHDTIFIFSDQ